MPKQIHVVPDGKRWAVKSSGTPNPLSTHRTQGDAIQAAKPLAQMLRTELVIHKPDGTIRDKDSFGNDPFPPRDTKH